MDKNKNYSGLKLKYLWTWDHSTNWDLNADGQLDWGCSNAYLKSKQTYLADYEKLIDYASSININGILIWGFLRDVHGGVEYAKEICKYARKRGISIFPGIGTSGYGGFYYEGNHPYNVNTWLKKHPHYARVDKKGNRVNHALCPTHPDNIKWLIEGTQWLFETFKIDGANLENGDFAVCYCDRCKRKRRKFGTDDVDYFKDQYFSYMPLLEYLNKKRYKWVTYATYTGFLKKDRKEYGELPYSIPYLQKKPPLFTRAFPENAICQWTLTGMIRQNPLPLEAYLKNGVPSDVYKNSNWPKDAIPPTKRNVGNIHQGSQWYRRNNKGFTRYSLEISSIKETCLRAYQAGFEGISIFGEVSAYTPVWDLNYQAFSYFADKPEASLNDFAAERLSKCVGGSEIALLFIKLLANHELGKLAKRDFAQLSEIVWDFQKKVVHKGDKYEAFRRWLWLLNYIGKGNEHMIKYYPGDVPYFKDEFLLTA